ncbi:type II secretion system F family protein [Botrimarina mediterranea]|uniref:Bacterial type II secretion system protein F domain protein n=1 Tax=Botrimarina mediterranea TaxID=2528022 RepID=A0A518KA50_9BACT|nr:type II secretion system F family protein [Botrimarina mediterranea]QDV74660.1 Bacterial type II secretion system protein F domain protein [Botrimarina mediterranea]
MTATYFPTFRKLANRLRTARWPSYAGPKGGDWFPTFAPWFMALLGRGGVTPTQRRALLRLIQVAAEERLALAPLVAAWAQEEPSSQRIRLIKLSQSLADGLSIADAVERFPVTLSDEEILLVRFASESGTLVSSLKQYLAIEVDIAAPVRSNLRRAKNYLLMFVLIGTPLALWVYTFIGPALEQIDDDFGVGGSALRPINDLQHFVFDWIVPFSIGAIAILIASRWMTGPWRRLGRSVAPMLFGSVRRLRTAHLLQRLSESCAAGKPLAGALSTLARNHYDPALRHKLLYARNELALGAELWPSFHAAGLLTDNEARALGASERLDANESSGVTVWTLATLADGKQRLAIRKQTWLSMALWLAVVLLFGAFVLVQAIGMFTFLSDIVYHNA